MMKKLTPLALTVAAIITLGTMNLSSSSQADTPDAVQQCDIASQRATAALSDAQADLNAAHAKMARQEARIERLRARLHRATHGSSFGAPEPGLR